MRHISEYTNWFSADWNNRDRVPATDWESDWNGNNTAWYQFLPKYNIAQWEDENFIMTYNQQKENAGYTQVYNQGLQLLLQGMIPQPGERHPEKNYWAMMQIFNRNITDELQFWEALKYAYAYYKESSVGATLRKSQKATNYFNKKEVQFTDKKAKGKLCEYIIFNVHDGKCFSCGKKGHYMRDCPDKEKFKGFTQIKREDRPEVTTEKYSKKEKGDAFTRMLATRAAKFEKGKKKAEEENKPQATFGEGRYPKQDKSKFCENCRTYSHNTADCYSHRAKEVKDPIVFYAQKQKKQQYRNNNYQNYRRKQIYNAETTDQDISKYQGYQDYLKAKQAYNKEAIPEVSEDEAQYF
ncbi:17100_t:CDS:2 [Gigaspora margarita]|uniref:17100_t:CDS:1 n=1 Tax=Gigaspora margarita TaxID=4874 RepID=A0ABN7VDZ8_GIGMA|nr:17100_t:CDS:2 [Gigaspora margarita]